VPKPSSPQPVGSCSRLTQSRLRTHFASRAEAVRESRQYPDCGGRQARTRLPRALDPLRPHVATPHRHRAGRLVVGESCQNARTHPPRWDSSFWLGDTLPRPRRFCLPVRRPCQDRAKHSYPLDSARSLFDRTSAPGYCSAPQSCIAGSAQEDTNTEDCPAPVELPVRAVAQFLLRPHSARSRSEFKRSRATAREVRLRRAPVFGRGNQRAAGSCDVTLAYSTG